MNLFYFFFANFKNSKKKNFIFCESVKNLKKRGFNVLQATKAQKRLIYFLASLKKPKNYFDFLQS